MNYDGRCFRVASEFGALSLLRNRAQLREQFNVTVAYPQTFPPRTMPVYLAWNAGGVEPQDGTEIQEVGGAGHSLFTLYTLRHAHCHTHTTCV
jgi:hypothetical protein